MRLTFTSGASSAPETFTVDVEPDGDSYVVKVGDRHLRVEGGSPQAGRLHLRVDGRPYRAFYARDGATRQLAVGERRLGLSRSDGQTRRGRAEAEGNLTSPMPGQVLKVAAHVGQRVAKGDVLLIIEAMKMEHTIRAPWAGVVAALHFKEGEMVTPGASLAEVTPLPPAP